MRIPHRCPSCGGSLKVQQLSCPACTTRVEGEFPLCPVCSLEEEDRALLDLFLRVRGNAKGVERALGISYPTVRARLEQLWQRLEARRSETGPPSQEPGGDGEGRPSIAILDDLERGRIDVSRAAALLRSRGQGRARSGKE